MGTYKKALTTVGAIDQGADETQEPTAGSSGTDYTMLIADLARGNALPRELVEDPGIITRYLRHGEQHAISTSELCRLTGSDVRHIRALVNRERLAGSLILSAQGKYTGYYLPADGEEGVREMLRSYNLGRAKAIGYLAALAPLYRELKRRGAFDLCSEDQLRIEGAD